MGSLLGLFLGIGFPGPFQPILIEILHWNSVKGTLRQWWCFFLLFQDSKHSLSFSEPPVLIVFPALVLLLFAIKELISGELTLLFREGTCSYLGTYCKSKHAEPLKREIKRCWQEGVPVGLGDFLATCIMGTQNNWVTFNYRGEKDSQKFHRWEVAWLMSSVSLGRGGVCAGVWKDTSLFSPGIL